MQIWPRLDGPGMVAVCPRCPPPPAEPPPSGSGKAGSQPTTAGLGASRIRDLLSQSTESGSEIPDSLLEELPEETRQLLARKPAAKPATGPLREELTNSLLRQGYVISEDPHGVRISGAPSARPGGGGGLSASDVVRMAADLDGGILPEEQRLHCPKCDAVLSRSATRCEWCGETIPPSPDPA